MTTVDSDGVAVKGEDLVVTGEDAELAYLVADGLMAFERYCEIEGSTEANIFTNADGLLDLTDEGKAVFRAFAAGYASRERDLRDKAEQMMAAFGDLMDAGLLDELKSDGVTDLLDAAVSKIEFALAE